VRRHAAPTLVAATLALAYVIVAPASVDLAAQLLRVKLFGAEGFGLWNNWWYAGHDVLGYSVLFPPLAWLLTPQIVAAVAATASAPVFDALVRDHFGEDARLGSLLFAVATATNLLSGRLTFALGLLPALGCALALTRRRLRTAALLAALAALCSPVAALFAALAGAANAIGSRTRDDVRAGARVIVAALGPVLVLAIAFPEGGTEPFAFSALWPVLLIAALALATLPAYEQVLRAGIALYALGTLAAFLIATPVGGNAARLGALIAAPLATILYRDRMRLLLLALVPLLYVQWQAAVRDVATAAGNPSTDAAYYQPLLRFLARQPGPPFRIEIPFTTTHWEAYEVAPRFPIARGWERQLDERDNALFYDGRLTPARYEAWLHQLAVRFVAVPDVALDYSAEQEAALIHRGLPYLRPVFTSAHWHVYAVTHATGIVTGVAVLRALGANSVTLVATRAGAALVRVRYSPYWRLSGAPGCVSPSGDFTRVDLTRAGLVRLVIGFSLTRIDSRAPRCT
jgi:hypothetical protein